MAVLNNRHSTLHILFTTVKCNQTGIFQIYPFLAFSIFISILFLLFLKNHYLQSRYNYCHLVMLLYFHKYLFVFIKVLGSLLPEIMNISASPFVISRLQNNSTCFPAALSIVVPPKRYSVSENFLYSA